MDIIEQFINSISIETANPLFNIGIFFIAGILSSLFPCYYPLIPITIGFLQKKSSEYNYIWIAPFLYWLGTLFLYMILGIIASSTGIILSKIMQNGWFILFLGILFLYLSFAMLDFVNLEPKFFRKLEEKTKQKKGKFFIFLMGFIAGLAASACVSPALVSILLFVAKISSELQKNTTTILYGILLTISYGAGIGLPFFLSGIIGAKLPRSGNWTNIIKYSFALIIFIIALYQIYKAFRVFGINEEIIYFILLLFTIFLILGYNIGKKIIKNIDIIKFNKIYVYFSLLLILFISIIIIPIYGKKQISLIDKKEILEYNYNQYEFIDNLKIYRSVQEAIEEAKKQNKPIFIDFYAEWCTNCVEFSHLMKNDLYLQSILRQTIILKIYDTDPAFDYFAEQKDFQELQIGLPFFVILSPDLKILYKTNYYKDFKNFEKAINKYYENPGESK
ncbi:MAG: peptide permease [Leptospiraceae bacterium]|nr:MAG: peptide permease [Leptospiraceae bacterium]